MRVAVLLFAGPSAAAAYTHLQFVGFPMQTGYNAFVSPGGLYYRETDGIGGYAGLGDEHGDVRGRIGLLNETLHALAASPLIDQRPTTLKVFAAPEFFFRGAAGAYNLSHTRTAEGLAESLGGLIAGDAWKDWIAFFGTTIGFQPSDTSAVATSTDGGFAKRKLVDTYNFALIRRGGSNGERHLHFKHYISSIDFLDATPGDDGTITFPEMNVSLPKGTWPKPMRRVTKKYPILSGAARKGLERTAGPTVDGTFHIANVSFCLDICLDHAMGVCAKALDKEKAAGTGPGVVSIHAIVSAGMSIQPRHVRVPPGGSAILSDGLGAGAQQSIEGGGGGEAAMVAHVHAATKDEARASVGEAAVENEAKAAGSNILPNMVLDENYSGRVKSTAVDVFGEDWKSRVNTLFAVQRYGASRPPWEETYSYDGVAEEAWAFLKETKPMAHVFKVVPIVSV